MKGLTLSSTVLRCSIQTRNRDRMVNRRASVLLFHLSSHRRRRSIFIKGTSILRLIHWGTGQDRTGHGIHHSMWMANRFVLLLLVGGGGWELCQGLGGDEWSARLVVSIVIQTVINSRSSFCWTYDRAGARTGGLLQLARELKLILRPR